MNRDVYSIMLGKAKHVIRLNLLNVDNKWRSQYPVHEDAVKGFGFCKCVLMCLRNANPDRQEMSDIVDTWGKLTDIHHSDNLYRLVPIRATCTDSLGALQSICKSPASPFHIDHRLDPIYSKVGISMNIGSPLRDGIERFFGGRVAIEGVDFDGILTAPHHLGLMILRARITEHEIQYFARMMDFFTSSAMFDGTQIDEKQFRVLLNYPPERRYLFLAGQHTIAQMNMAPLANFALRFGIHLYHKNKKGVFQYVPPSQQSQMPDAADGGTTTMRATIPPLTLK